METTIYLHIGTPKTGTTALQNFLPDNQEKLNEHGIVYPDFGFRYNKIGKNRNAHFLVARYYDEQGERITERERRDYEEGFEKLSELAPSYDKIILSDEGLWKDGYDQEGFWEQLNEDLIQRNLQVKIIVYFRRQDLFAQSHWAQKVKEGAPYDFKGYQADPIFLNYPLNYYRYVNHLADIFGKEALIIRVFEKGQYAGEEHTIHSDFLNIFGLKISDGFRLNREIYNTSLQGNYLEMKRLLNTADEFRDMSGPLTGKLKKLQDCRYFDYNNKKVSYFTPEEQQAFMERFDASNAALAREYLGRRDGRLFYEKPEELPVYSIEQDKMTLDMFLYTMKLIQYQDEEIRKLRTRLHHLEDEYRESLLQKIKRWVNRLIGR